MSGLRAGDLEGDLSGCFANLFIVMKKLRWYVLEGMVLGSAAMGIVLSTSQNAKAVVSERSPADVTEAEAELREVEAVNPETLAPSERIDFILAKGWREHGEEPNPPASDEIFLRRIFLGVSGRIPTKDEAVAFYADERPDRRARLIDGLLESEGYVNHFFNFWADILRVNSQRGGGRDTAGFYTSFIKDALRDDMRYDEFVRAMMTATGDPYDNGAVGYTIRDRGMPLDHMANTVRVFLGTRLECAQCHNHPFDKWTQMDFFHMAGFSYGMEARNNGNSGTYGEVTRMIQQDKEMDRDRKRDLQRAMQEIRRPLRQANGVTYAEDKLPQLPKDYQYGDAEPKQKVEPRAMFGEMPEITSPDERVEKYAEWMTSPGTGRFTKVIVNRLWREAMGRGLVEPADEFMDDTVAANPKLMDYLEEQMIELGYDMKAFLRMIYNTEVYQREATRTEIALGDDYHFTGPLMKRMSAEQVWDSLVTLMNPTPDRPDWKQQQQYELRMAAGEAFVSAIDAKSPQALMKSAEKIAGMQKDMRGKLERLEADIRKAREAKKGDRVQELTRETGGLRNEIREGVMKLVYAPVLKKMSSKMVPVSYVGNGEAGGALEVKMSMVDNQGRPTREFQQLQAEIEEDLLAEEMEAAGILDEKEQRSYAGYRRNISQRFMRAANLPSPAPRGHFLREFGQSDRITIENANDDASVLQALALMNGNTFNDIMHHYSVFSRNVRAVDSPSEKVEVIYLTFLGRRPTEEEQAFLLGELDIRGEAFVGDAVFALLNSREFMFVQ
jgi:hypothetical protein